MKAETGIHQTFAGDSNDEPICTYVVHTANAAEAI